MSKDYMVYFQASVDRALGSKRAAIEIRIRSVESKCIDGESLDSAAVKVVGASIS